VVSKLLGDQIKDFLLVGDIRERDRSRVKIRDPFFFFFLCFFFLSEMLTQGCVAILQFEIFSISYIVCSVLSYFTCSRTWGYFLALPLPLSLHKTQAQTLSSKWDAC